MICGLVFNLVIIYCVVELFLICMKYFSSVVYVMILGFKLDFDISRKMFYVSAGARVLMYALINVLYVIKFGGMLLFCILLNILCVCWRILFVWFVLLMLCMMFLSKELYVTTFGLIFARRIFVSVVLVSLICVFFVKLLMSVEYVYMFGLMLFWVIWWRSLFVSIIRFECVNFCTSVVYVCISGWCLMCGENCMFCLSVFMVKFNLL